MAKKDNKEMKTSGKENNKNKKSFWKGFKAELKKVNWPTPKQLFNNTVAVITIVLITTLIVFVLDLAFESMNKYGVNKLKETISNSNTTSEDITENTTDDNSEITENTENNENSENNANESTIEVTSENTEATSETNNSAENGTTENQ